MRILLLTHSFNSLAQRLHGELTALGHQVSVEFDIHDGVTREAVALFRPDLILAPYLKRAIPEDIWRSHLCLILHPGVVGDRGPSALDWAILRGEATWGATLLQAEAEMDAGPVWASREFPLRAATKSSLYRNEVTEAAVACVLEALARLPDYRVGRWQPRRPEESWARPLLRQTERAIDWARDDTATVLRKIRSGDSQPGVLDLLFGQPCRLFDAHADSAAGAPGQLLGRRGTALVRATVDGAVRIGQVRRSHDGAIKLPATRAFPEAAEITELADWGDEMSEIRYEEDGPVGYLHFAFYNGAMGTAACDRLRAAIATAKQRPTRVIVLLGGPDFFSNGLDLNLIEAAESPADESLRNIEAMDDLCREILVSDQQLMISALQGNAGAGGAFLALAADRVWAREGILLNPHYKNMGNLYGSEYWTWLLPRRLGEEGARSLMQRRLPLGAAEAKRIGFIDECYSAADFLDRVRGAAVALAEEADSLLQAKRTRLATELPAMEACRREELARMRRNFYGFDPSYHVARSHFVHKTPHSWTPRHLALHRELGWSVPTPC